MARLSGYVEIFPLTYNMPRRPRPAAESPEQLWERLSDAFQSLHCGTWPNQSSEQLYRAAYKLTLFKKGPWLLEKTSEWHTDWLRQHLLVKLHPFAQKLEDLQSPLCGDVSPLQREEAFSWVWGVVDVCDDVFRHYFTATTTIAEHLLTYVVSSSTLSLFLSIGLVDQYQRIL